MTGREQTTCTCAVLLPEGGTPAPCPLHGWTVEPGREQTGYWHQGRPLVGDDTEPHPLDADGVQPGREQPRDGAVSSFHPATVDEWRIQLEAVACGPVEGVWDGLRPVIESMRELLGIDATAREQT